MEELQISETELRYFGDLFVCCDSEKSGKVPLLKATELFRSSNLSNEIIRQILSLVGIPQNALHLSRKQFYSCLKLIAAHQASMPLREELITTHMSLPLPRFSWKDSPTSSPVADSNGLEDRDIREWRTNTNRSPDLIELNRESQNDTGNSDQPSTDSEVEHNEPCTGSSSRRLGGSPEAWSTASDSPTPTNSVADRHWAKGNLWQGLLCEEQRQLLGTEEESSDKHSSEEENDTDLESVYQITSEQKEYYIKQFKTVQPDPNGLLSGHIARVFFEKSRIPVEELRHIWQLCDVTKDGALSLAEFIAAMHLVVLRRNNIPLPATLPPCLMPNHGHTTNLQEPAEADLLHLEDDESTTLSKLNDSEYKRMLSSHTGGSSGGDTSLLFSMNQSTSSIGSNVSIKTTTQPVPQPLSNKYQQPQINHHVSGSPPILANSSTRITNRSVSNSPPPPESITPPQAPPQAPNDWVEQSIRDWNTNREWTKFTESPTSNVSSPGPKPVNFDMQRTAQAVVSDPQILHPVPLRVTPVGAESIDDESNRILKKADSIVYDSSVVQAPGAVQRDLDSSPKQILSRESLQNDIRPIQRPQPKKLPTKSIGALPPPPQREMSVPATSTTDCTDSVLSNITTSGIAGLGSKKEPPPLPPPRPHRHARSSSLDLNKLKLNAPSAVPPEVPPRVSPSQNNIDVIPNDTSFADFTQFTGSNDPNIANNVATKNPDNSGIGPVVVPRPSLTTLQTSQRTSAFEVYRKPSQRGSQSPEIINCSIGAFGGVGCSLSRTSEYEKRVSLISENLKHVTFKQDRSMNDVLQHLKEQNILLLRLCNDLSEELLGLQQKKEKMRTKLELVQQTQQQQQLQQQQQACNQQTNV